MLSEGPQYHDDNKLGLANVICTALGSWADEMEDAPLASECSASNISKKDFATDSLAAPGGGNSGYGGDRRAFSSQPSFGGDRGGAYGMHQQAPHSWTL